MRRSRTGRRWAHATRMTRAIPRRCRYGSFKRNCFAAVRTAREPSDAKGRRDAQKGCKPEAQPPQIPHRGRRRRRQRRRQPRQSRDRGGAAATIAVGAAAERPCRRRRDRRAGYSALCRRGPARIGFHGRRHQDARHQIPAGQSGLELSRHPRVADQLRQEHDAGIPHLHPRGSRRRHRPRLLQDRQQAADDAVSTARSG